MSRHSVKAAGRSTKTAGRTVKKNAKSARATAKKPSKSARSPVGKATQTKSIRPKSLASKSLGSKSLGSKPIRPVRAAALAAPSATKSTIKSAIKHPPQMLHTPSPPVQPLATLELPTSKHRYHVGEMVYYTSPTFGRAAANGSYTVVKLLPSEGDDYQYRIKSNGEAFERVAKESQLDKA